MKTYSEKLGRIGIITENDGSNYSARIYLCELLNQHLGEYWDIDFLILNDHKDLSPKLKQARCKIFEPVSVDPSTMASPSGLIQSGLNLGDEIGRAMPVYQHLMNETYDAFIFIGLSPSLCSLLPLTRRRNCMVPLLSPGDWHYFINNQALRTALLSCDYFLCHSAKEAALITSLQPHAEVKHFPLMIDPEFVIENSAQRKITFDEPFVLMIAEIETPTVLNFASGLREKGHRVVLGLDLGSKAAFHEEMPVVDMMTIAANYREWIPQMRGAFLFFGRQFFPIVYNFCQYNIPLYLAPNYPWHDLIDGDSLSFLSFDRDPDFERHADSVNAIPYGYHHYRYFVNYWIRFLQEWCINSRLRCENVPWKLPTPAPAKRTAQEIFVP